MTGETVGTPSRLERGTGWIRASVTARRCRRTRRTESCVSPFGMRRDRTAMFLALLLVPACGAAPAAPRAADTAPAPTVAQAPADALPSWNEGHSKQAIVEFVKRVTEDGGPEFVDPPARIAVFDNDGTLWSEQPIYNQLAFAFDRVRALAPRHPEWRWEQPFQGILDG